MRYCASAFGHLTTAESPMPPTTDQHPVMRYLFYTISVVAICVTVVLCYEAECNRCRCTGCGTVQPAPVKPAKPTGQNTGALSDAHMLMWDGAVVIDANRRPCDCGPACTCDKLHCLCVRP